MIVSESKVISVLFNILLVLFFLLPQNIVLYALVPIGYLLMIDSGIKQNGRLHSYFTLVLLFIFLSFVFNILEPWIDIKSALRALELIIIFYCFGRQKVVEISKWTIVFLSFYIVGSQFSIFFPKLDSLIDSIYPITEAEEILVLKGADADDIGSYSVRFGGFYRNPNTCAMFLNLLFALAIIERRKFGKFDFWIVLAVIFLGIILSGSRTAFVVLMAFFLIYLHSSNRKIFVRIIPAIAVVGTVVYFVGDQLLDFRLFQVGSGLKDSMTEKASILFQYIERMPSFIILLFGCFTIQATKYIVGGSFGGTDNDLGNILVAYGIIFYFILIGFYMYLYRKLSKEYKILLALLLWSISGSLIFAYRVVAVLMLILSIYYRKSSELKSFQKNLIIDKKD